MARGSKVLSDREEMGEGSGTVEKQREKILHTGDIESLDRADSSTNTTVGWTKNTQKPKKKFKTEKIIQKEKTQKHLELCLN